MTVRTSRRHARRGRSSVLRGRGAVGALVLTVAMAGCGADEPATGPAEDPSAATAPDDAGLDDPVPDEPDEPAEPDADEPVPAEPPPDQPDADEPVTAADRGPLELEGRSLAGGELDVAALGGSHVVLWMWAPW